eukprot:CAMPEP_0206318278 /NCGR_PEP_ID=MMETSP0106_2-20121207/17095_1 /ASSEMBLY_ACC=CAM_ASM_000206 /TAXON_ID=81532 /ORGANISM="Acanthoeca-like sp., Strain 10tr" /LENGTH=137 /DNA_ID=CAMNT_0053749949 /DNA_START=21 /DNA_END=430 /DNA_ORIENTATION=+
MKRATAVMSSFPEDPPAVESDRDGAVTLTLGLVSAFRAVTAPMASVAHVHASFNYFELDVSETEGLELLNDVVCRQTNRVFPRPSLPDRAIRRQYRGHYEVATWRQRHRRVYNVIPPRRRVVGVGRRLEHKVCRHHV